MRNVLIVLIIVLVYTSGILEQYVPTLAFYGLLALSSFFFLNLRFTPSLLFIIFCLFDYLLFISFLYDKLPDFVFELYFLFFLFLWLLQYNRIDYGYGSCNSFFINRVFLFLFFVSGAIGVFQRLGYLPLISEGFRPMGFTSGPLTYGWVMSLSLLFLGFRFSVPVNISIFFFGLLFAFYVGSKLFFLVSIIAFISYLSYLMISVRSLLLKLSIVLSFSVMIYAFIPVVYNTISYLLSSDVLTSVGRFDRYYMAIDYIYDNPFGAGVGTFGSVANNFGDALGSSESFILYVFGQVGVPIGVFMLVFFLLRIPVWSVPVILGFFFTEAVISMPAWVFTFIVYSYSKNYLSHRIDSSVYRVIFNRFVSSC